MKIREVQGRLKVAAPAKINLFLEIVGKRSDGYHELVTVMQKVSLFDYVFLEDNAEEVLFTCSNSKLSVGEDNLVLRAIRLLQKESKVDKGVKIYLEKNIPMGAGLGGGSSDAVATLFGLNRLWRIGYNEEQLLSLAGELGSDTAFFASGNTAFCKGRGEIVSPCVTKVKCYYVIVYPGFEVSTSVVYKYFKIDLTKKLKDVSLFARLLVSGSVEELGACLFNRLEEVVFRLYPELEKTKKALAQFSFCGTLLSGSGSALYGICRKESDAKEIGRRLKALNIGDVFVVTNDF
ncbi:MAG: 4-(cytidine 5'-diphospho)-2-C-methyl-D-erythritol kinase [Candidatus Brocadiaceae bacterium]|nr:4-(cytidine 5'-diphospho)-2-C-methyl-D-erythritol kinase [Candidatus Brocadiaceae bacterium]